MKGIMSWYETLQVNSGAQEYLGMVQEATVFVVACLVKKLCPYLLVNAAFYNTQWQHARVVTCSPSPSKGISLNLPCLQDKEITINKQWAGVCYAPHSTETRLCSSLLHFRQRHSSLPLPTLNRRESNVVHFLSATRTGRAMEGRTTDSRRERTSTIYGFK